VGFLFSNPATNAILRFVTGKSCGSVATTATGFVSRIRFSGAIDCCTGRLGQGGSKVATSAWFEVLRRLRSRSGTQPSDRVARSFTTSHFAKQFFGRDALTTLSLGDGFEQYGFQLGVDFERFR
jgi:hypothetical protein